MRRVTSTIEELLERVERREPFDNPDGRSTSAFERVWIDGRPHIVKYVHPDDDFMMRASGDIGWRTVRAWTAGLLDSAPDLVDSTVVGAATGTGRNGWGAALLMRDVSAEMLPSGPVTVPEHEHAAFLDHVAGFCASTWGWRDDDRAPAYLPYRARWEWFGEAALSAEQAVGWGERLPQIAYEGWQRFASRAPQDLEAGIAALRLDVSPLADALRSTPSCFLHGDVKASNTGIASDGRTVLIDWAYVGEGPACHELAWHLALDRDKLPISKEATIERFRAALEGHGVSTSSWWERQIDLCLLGALVQFGWEKAYGDDDELAWWCAAARSGLRHL